MRATAYAVALICLVASVAAFPLDGPPVADGELREGAGDVVSLAAEDAAPASKTPVRGKQEAAANKAAVKIEKENRKNAEAAAAKRAAASESEAKELDKMTTRDLDNKLDSMDADKQPIDVMAEKYKSLHVKQESTPKSVLAAQANAKRVSAMERKMKKKNLAKSKVFEKYTRMKIPTLAGMKLAIKTTVNANMKQAVGDLPYKGAAAWGTVLPNAMTVKKWENAATPAGAKAPSKGAVENKMLSQRQASIDRQEKKLAQEKAAMKAQMVNVAKAANKFESKTMSREKNVSVAAQKKVHDAQLAVDLSLNKARRAKDAAYAEQLKLHQMKRSLARAVASRLSTKKAAESEIRDMKHEQRLAESRTLRRLKKLFETRIKAMAKGAQVLARQKMQAQTKQKTLEAKLRYVKSKLKLQDRQDRRQRVQEKKLYMAKTTKMWQNRIKRTKRLAALEEKQLQTELTASQRQAAIIAKHAVKNQHVMQRLAIPLRAQQLAAKLQNQNTAQISRLTKTNSKMRTKIQDLVTKLNAFKKIQIRQKVVIGSEKKANKKLVGVVRKVDARREAADKTARNKRVDLQVARENLSSLKSKFAVEKEMSGMTTTQQQVAHLLSTPCHGDACKPMTTAAKTAGTSNPSL